MSDKILTAAKTAASAVGGWAFVAGAAVMTAAFIAVLALAFFKEGFGARKRTIFLIFPVTVLSFSGAVCALGGLNGGLFVSECLLGLAYAFAAAVVPARKKDFKKAKELTRLIDAEIKGEGTNFAVKKEQSDNERFSANEKTDNSAPPLSHIPDYIKRAAANAAKPAAEVRGAKTFSPDAGSIAARKVSGGSAPVKSAPIKSVSAKPAPARAEKQSGAFGDLDFTHVKNVISRLDYCSLSQSDRRQVHELESYIIEAERGAEEKGLKEKINDGLSSLLKIMSKYGA